MNRFSLNPHTDAVIRKLLRLDPITQRRAEAIIFFICWRSGTMKIQSLEEAALVACGAIECAFAGVQ